MVTLRTIKRYRLIVHFMRQDLEPKQIAPLMHLSTKNVYKIIERVRRENKLSKFVELKY